MSGFLTKERIMGAIPTALYTGAFVALGVFLGALYSSEAADLGGRMTDAGHAIVELAPVILLIVVAIYVSARFVWRMQ